MVTATPEKLASYLLEDAVNGDPKHTIAAMRHRSVLVSRWNIAPGSRVLELGCGSGDSTVVLADQVGPNGFVTAVDPAPLDYGTPTMQDGRSHVLASPVGSRISFVQDEPSHFLSTTTEKWDYVVLVHCIWYFDHPSLLQPMLELAMQKARYVCIAEYALATSLAAAMPHVLVALAVNALESLRSSKVNIRSALSPRQIGGYAADAGLKVVSEDVVQPAEGQRDGYREVWMGLHKMFDAAVETIRGGDKEKSMLHGMQDALRDAVDRVEGGLQGVRNMDVWVVKYESA